MESLSQAYILHRRLFRDSSLIVDFFTHDQGYISVVAKGARSEKSKLRAALQYFNPLLISCYGRSELLGLKSVETNGRFHCLSGNYLLSMLYVNELLTKLLQKFEPHPGVFLAYQHLVEQFAMEKNIEENLRRFETQLLQELGYGLNFLLNHREESTLENNAFYVFHLDEGLKQVNSATVNTYSGEILQKIYQEDFSQKDVLIAAKQLFRQLFNELLQHKTINSRQLFSFARREKMEKI